MAGVVAFVATVLVVLFGYFLLTVPDANAAQVRAATVERAYAVAEFYWQAQGQDPCNGHVEQFVFTADYAGALGRAYIGPFADGDPNCEVDLNTATNWRREAAYLAANAREYVCAVVVHERGHNLGLPHAFRGIMAPELRRVPRACKANF